MCSSSATHFCGRASLRYWELLRKASLLSWKHNKAAWKPAENPKTDDPFRRLDLNYRAPGSSGGGSRALANPGLCLFQVHDHEGVLARRAVAAADLQAAGRGSRPGSIDDLHRRECPCTADNGGRPGGFLETLPSERNGGD